MFTRDIGPREKEKAMEFCDIVIKMSFKDNGCRTEKMDQDCICGVMVWN